MTIDLDLYIQGHLVCSETTKTWHMLLCPLYSTYAGVGDVNLYVTIHQILWLYYISSPVCILSQLRFEIYHELQEHSILITVKLTRY